MCAVWSLRRLATDGGTDAPDDGIALAFWDRAAPREVADYVRGEAEYSRAVSVSTTSSCPRGHSPDVPVVSLASALSSRPGLYLVVVGDGLLVVGGILGAWRF